MNTFLKVEGLMLNPAGYLVAIDGEKPVTHNEFVEQQRHAEFVVKVAEASKGKNFKHGEVADLNKIMQEVKNSLSSQADVMYVNMPNKPNGELTNKLAEEAMAFVNFDKSRSEAEKVNETMQEFNAIYAIETVGDYFSEGLVKLNRIYSISEIKSAIEIISAI